MKKIFVCFLALMLVLTGCTSAPAPEKPAETESKFQQEASAPAQESSKAEASQPAETAESSASAESSQPAQAEAAWDGMYQLITMIYANDDGVLTTEDMTAPGGQLLYATISGTSASYWMNGNITDTTFDPVTGKTEVSGEPGTLTLDGDTLTLVDETDGFTYIFRRLNAEEAAAAKTVMESQPAAPTTNEYGTLCTDSDVEIIEQHVLDDGYGYYNYITAFKNNMPTDKSFNIRIYCYDANNNEIANTTGYLSVVGSGDEAVITALASCDQAPDHAEYELYYEDPWYQACAKDVEVKASYYEDQLTIEAINHGTVDAMGVEVTALFYDAEGNFVDTDYVYLSNLAPGDYSASNIYTWDGVYDSVTTYITAYTDGTASTPVDPATVIEKVAEYESVSMNYYTRVAILKNISAEPVQVYAQYIIRDANGLAVDVASDNFEVIGAGETVAFYSNRSTPEGLPIASKELVLEVMPVDYYLPCVSDLSHTETDDGSKVEVSVTNNGTGTPEFVTATVVFFDAEGNMLHANYSYAGDSDSEIKPGATETATIYGPSGGWDHYEVYLEGRIDKD